MCRIRHAAFLFFGEAEAVRGFSRPGFSVAQQGGAFYPDGALIVGTPPLDFMTIEASMRICKCPQPEP